MKTDLIVALCKQGDFDKGYRLAIRRIDEGTMTEEKFEKVCKWIDEFAETGKEPTNNEVWETVAKNEKKAMTAAERKAKSREEVKKKGGEILGGLVLTSKASNQLSILCNSKGLNKNEVINKLLEEQEQLSLL